MEAGFSKIRIKPQPADVKAASIKVPTIRGDIVASFTNQPGKSFRLNVDIPANTTAEIWLPYTYKKLSCCWMVKSRNLPGRMVLRSYMPVLVSILLASAIRRYNNH
ncbi:alpha-L-rhamnosidase C-terminal domain-containing protein [Niabella hibiscisoli]|uniref:alpha-L-rhamnosidase C-terminal domain-containing protein n=1 Tax=Niabella hibiscisoli TaxID=1825928 RepID=UPI001F1000DB|nr:alpha-L-rhamnosidase C-terminal domain-containing protein [Niabella hibiscisoli]MCH5717922.1 hypothetical protein [Niabella hibiscisoli]